MSGVKSSGSSVESRRCQLQGVAKKENKMPTFTFRVGMLSGMLD